MPNGFNYTSGGASYVVSVGTLRLLVHAQVRVHGKVSCRYSAASQTSCP